ncbi:MAG: phosphate ABC transporter ATP-binding protein, partial [bacterium]
MLESNRALRGGVEATAGQERSPRPLESPAIQIEGLFFSYGQGWALQDISLAIPSNEVTAFIGPSGCGKSTLLRCLNRLNDLIDGAQVQGKVWVQGTDIYAPACDVTQLRKQVGMVFQKSNPFPKSIYDNVAYGLRIVGVKNRHRLDELVERSLR